MSESDNALKSLRTKRGQIKSAVTRFSTFLNSLNNLSDNNLSAVELRQRTTKFQEHWQLFDDIQSQIDEVDLNEIDGTEREDFENNYFRLISKAEDLIARHNQSTIVHTSNNLNGPTSNTENQLQNQIRLPRITLPSFTGLYEEWFTFYNTFSSLIHSNNSITDIQKFQYLKSSVSGKASDVIQSLEISAENYQEAWALLKNRYDNKRIIVRNHVKAIYELPVLTKESFAGLREIVDGILKHLRALKALKRPTETWDDLLTHLITAKLDPITNKEWESRQTSNELPTINQLIEFLTHKCQTLEVISKGANQQTITPKSKSVFYKSPLTHVLTKRLICQLCSQEHYVVHCDKFLAMPIEQRIAEMKSKRMCLNCLRTTAHRCYASSCRTCHKRHNTLLHLPVQQSQVMENAVQAIATSQSDSINGNNSTDQAQHATTSYHSLPLQELSTILLSTALINVCDSSGNQHVCRVLLDSGSQSNFVTSSLVARLNLHKESKVTPVAGINQASVQVHHAVTVCFKSRFNAFGATIKCLVLNKITENLPQVSICKTNFLIPPNIKLADPEFFSSKEVDMLIGAELFWRLLCVGQIKKTINQPLLQKTHLGWLVTGKIVLNNITTSTVCNLSTSANLDFDLRRFWELEDCKPHGNLYSDEENTCENHFLANMTRDINGRFIVKLPTKANIKLLGESYEAALKRFLALEKRLNKQPAIKCQYHNFMKEYELLGHMKLVTNTTNTTTTYYLPHHAVIKEDSLTSKLRVVYDGSAKTSSGLSLNDILMVGPPIQQDIFEILLRFRIHKYVLTADIEKMYRQVRVNEEDVNLQRILWRSSEDEPVSIFQLMTVTYGTACAPFLAMRCLRQLAVEQQERFPEAAGTILRDFYVDDGLFGGDSIQEVITIRNDLIVLLQQAGFTLRKWASNENKCLENLPVHDTEANALFLDKDKQNKTLGLLWKAAKDSLQYSIKTDKTKDKVTKRTILSAVASIYDPLGLLGPVTITAKLIMQQLWQLGLEWDESLPIELYTTWNQYRDQLSVLNKISVDRRVVCNSPRTVQLHCFCDASENAYGGCVYIRSEDYHGNVTTRLLCSKSRVAPLKNITLPKLELCGALLLAQLFQRVDSALGLRFDNCYFWTDSTITLAWLSAAPNTWKTFTANRVSQIQEITRQYTWQHVRTFDNPADLISRGIQPIQLQECNIWWTGPTWLSQNSSEWPVLHQFNNNIQDLPEKRKIVAALTSVVEVPLFEKYSSLTRLIRVTAYCLRFINNIRNPKQLRVTRNLTPMELEGALQRLTKLAQNQEFSQEIQDLLQNQPISRKSKILSLNPFIDEQGVLRVGGRLKHAAVPYEQRHPILLPASHALTNLIIRNEHIKHLHAGPQLLMSLIRLRFWPLRIRNVVRKILRNCVICFKSNPTTTHQLMGNLPQHRITPSRPFNVCGIDYAGPFLIKEGTRRSRSVTKAYLAIFVCFTTKAVHLELVSSLTSESFLNTLQRFISRRGKCSHIYSDNATNFVGAKNELVELQDFLTRDENLQKIEKSLSEENITWHFIPARSPHFGGIWEAAVKSAKRHLRKIVGDAKLTFEEMYTLLVKIEACLNSRPLTPFSNNPNDLTVLTPGHFLIGDSLAALPEKNFREIPTNRLSRWERVCQLNQHFWKRWSTEYLATLQQRTKWKDSRFKPIGVNDMVLLRDDNSPSYTWQLGRVQELHPGDDGITRVVTLKTARGVVKRAVSKVCVLPIQQDDVSNLRV